MLLEEDDGPVHLLNHPPRYHTGGAPRPTPPTFGPGPMRRFFVGDCLAKIMETGLGGVEDNDIDADGDCSDAESFEYNDDDIDGDFELDGVGFGRVGLIGCGR